MKLAKIVDHDEEGEDQDKKDRYLPELPVLPLQFLNILHRDGEFPDFKNGLIEGFPPGEFSEEFSHLHPSTQLGKNLFLIFFLPEIYL